MHHLSMVSVCAPVRSIKLAGRRLRSRDCEREVHGTDLLTKNIAKGPVGASNK